MLAKDTKYFTNQVAGLVMLENRMVSSMLDGTDDSINTASCMGIWGFSLGPKPKKEVTVSPVPAAGEANGAGAGGGAPSVDPDMDIRAWLLGVNPSLATYAEVMAEAGADNVGMLLELDADDQSELMDTLTESGAKKLHVKKIQKALAKLCSDAEAAAEGGGGDAAAAAVAAALLVGDCGESEVAAAKKSEDDKTATKKERGSVGVGTGFVDMGEGERTD